MTVALVEKIIIIDGHCHLMFYRVLLLWRLFIKLDYLLIKKKKELMVIVEIACL